MAQANIKERIKEMRLRVLAEPLEDVTVQDGEPHLDVEIETAMPDANYIKKPKNNNEERNMYHQVLRRATLTSTPVSTIIKQYVDEGVKNDRFLQLFDK